ncbi:hypothetical protein [Chitinophaga arvensicola]|uniref:Tetratricopeptide repeat-containing protein n=1 Tax=Chitinophaga arvensicola TaxID=29529 RepID=A0A1I0RNH2_9BACT|nr:hypothetical protein [Chitinophaga arvensicola]SEW42791.1 hypothetical protein SAMN04488122_3142 [Chitinophaga arvensicola]
MKKLFISALLFVSGYSTHAQSDALQAAVNKLDQAKTVSDYTQLEKTFTGAGGSPAWLSPYYAALCNAKIGFLLQDDGDKIEPYSERGEQQAKQALALLDSTRQRRELAEVYTVLSMIYRTKVFINPMTYGRKYGMLSQQMLDKAMALEPQNPRALYVAAWVKYYTPRMWGGDKEKAKQLAGESLAKLANPGTDVYPHWGKAEDQLLLSKIK